MKDNLEDKNCIPGQKPWYSIAEAAILWCNIKGRGVQVDANGLPEDDPNNPCLRARGMMIYDAIHNNELQHGRDGRKVEPGDHVAWHRRTIRHNDLKKWMAENFPDQRPVFLFDEIERNTHSAINADSFRSLQADRDALQRQLNIEKETIKKMELEKYELAAKLKQHEMIYKQIDGDIDPRSEKTYLNIIGALLEVITGTFKDESFSSETQLRNFIEEKFDDLKGVKARTLAEKFALAKKALNDDL